LTNAP
jgi:hypothetical protein